jgi:hypothetical protein
VENGIPAGIGRPPKPATAAQAAFPLRGGRRLVLKTQFLT